MTPLARAMEERGQTVTQVAAAAGLERQTVQMLRDGTRLPHVRTAERIARVVGVASAELFPGAGAREPTPLAAELARRHVSAREIARAAGVHENSVYAWAAGRATPTAEKAVRLAETLGIPAGELFAAAPERPHRGPRIPSARTSSAPSTRPASAAEAEAFTRRVAETMEARNLSAASLAVQAGVSRETISRWLSGATSPQRDAAEKVAAALDLRLEPWAPIPSGRSSLAIAVAERGWTTHQFAEAAGVEVDTARRWISGRSTPALDNAHRVAAALDRPLTDLFDLQPGNAARDDNGSSQPRPAIPTAADVLDRPATGDPDWRTGAACATDEDPERWWPDAGDPALEARATCGRCPVLGDCRDAFLAQPDRPTDRDGIWAGLFGHQLRTAARAQIREATGPASTPQAPHHAQGRARPRADGNGHQHRSHDSRDVHGGPAVGDRPAPGGPVVVTQGLAM